ncbi:hypothetical protein [Pseudodesulfovibrio sediminis]|uniref:Uncharacterized protein n=1 Tax=Pseudodesulfovibrio sediminis TaxID=2810563 RepID=A0ABM7PAA8_9BACT|nr:hypothetical protein [Pseudodesulfovibrio sediminis]BCS89958.1 hypothetical protein PSDVSF_32000 [Pseudodesulfovibrio sediminis]
MSWLRRKIQRSRQGNGNWFGDRSDGDIRIVSSAGAEQSYDGGVTWQPIPGWTIVGSVAMVPSVEDGDMVIINGVNGQIDAGYTLTTTNRCRGLQLLFDATLTIDGTVSMTARGCKANPADAVITSNTPVAPSDGSAVGPNGPTWARFAKGFTESGLSDMSGCGTDAVISEANQPEVLGNGVVVSIQPVGGLGGARLTVSTSAGNPGQTAASGLGGGGGGAVNIGISGTIKSGAGSAATCFSSGVGGGGHYNGYNSTPPGDGQPYGGQGGCSDDPSSGVATGGPGAGNPGGATYTGAAGGEAAEEGTAAPIFICARKILGTGAVESKGSLGGRGSKDRSQGLLCGGGSTGGGATILMSSEIADTITIDISGGTSVALGGAGGDGFGLKQIIDA